MTGAGPDKVRIGIRLTWKAYQQLLALADKFNMRPSAVMAQAIARWYNEEPLLRGNKITKRNKRTETTTPPNGADKLEGT